MQKQTLLLMGTSHTFSSLDLREKIFSNYCSQDEWIQKTYSELNSQIFSEVLIVSTCNRIEIYGIITDFEKGKNALRKKIPVKNIYIYTNQDAASHLFQVASGLDSMIPGEHEILGQVKKAYQTGVYEKKIGSFLHQLCRQAIHTAKHVRTQTNIGRGSASLTHAAVYFAKKHIQEFSTCQTLLIGAGEIAQKLAKHIAKKTRLNIMNRTQKHAEEIAKVYPVSVIPYDFLEQSLTTTDLVISAVTTAQPIINYSMVKKIMKTRNRPLCFIDLGVPRNIQTEVAKIDKVFRYDLDDIQQLINKNYTLRNEAIMPAQEIIQKERDAFWEWFLKRTV